MSTEFLKNLSFGFPQDPATVAPAPEFADLYRRRWQKIRDTRWESPAQHKTNKFNLRISNRNLDIKNIMHLFDLEQTRAYKISVSSACVLTNKNKEAAKNLNLRLIRSSSASLPPAVFKDLNDAFNCPVIEAYGMTEATHQMTSNPLPPKQQKAGFVGLPAGPEVCIMSENGDMMKQGEEGEVCIKGENVTHGYENNEEANKTSFTNGWFRTGDQGYFDEDGYLKISGRLKEIINKGGEKISPLEVDNVLMDHPSIDQAVCFGYEDKMLGENIASAIIIKSGEMCSEEDVLKYAQAKLAKFKIPKKIFFVDEIPKGATGKLQRNVLAKKFGLSI